MAASKKIYLITAETLNSLNVLIPPTTEALNDPSIILDEYARRANCISMYQKYIFSDDDDPQVLVLTQYKDPKQRNVYHISMPDPFGVWTNMADTIGVIFNTQDSTRSMICFQPHARMKHEQVTGTYDPQPDFELKYLEGQTVDEPLEDSGSSTVEVKYFKSPAADPRFFDSRNRPNLQWMTRLNSKWAQHFHTLAYQLAQTINRSLGHKNVNPIVEWVAVDHPKDAHVGFYSDETADLKHFLFDEQDNMMLKMALRIMIGKDVTNASPPREYRQYMALAQNLYPQILTRTEGDGLIRTCNLMTITLRCEAISPASSSDVNNGEPNAIAITPRAAGVLGSANYYRKAGEQNDKIAIILCTERRYQPGSKELTAVGVYYATANITDPSIDRIAVVVIANGTISIQRFSSGQLVRIVPQYVPNTLLSLQLAEELGDFTINENDE